MKTRFYKGLILGALLLAGSGTALHAQGFSVPWFVVAGGGGTTTNGSFSMTGTFGQWEATAQPLTNGLFALDSGFWSILEIPSPSVSTPSAPVIITNTEIVVAISSPANNFLSKTATVLVKGTVKGIDANGRTDQLELTVNSNAPVTVTGTILHGTLTWSYNAPLTPGANIITAQTFDTNGTEIVSVPVSRTVFYVTNTLVTADKSTLTLTVSPANDGKITGQKSGASLELYKVFTVTAAPVGNTVFTSWTLGTNTNDVLSYNPALSFIMTSNLSLQANFVPNPFTQVVGSYNGLFSPDTGVTEETSGLLTITLAATSKGAYSGKLLLDGGSYSFTGTFDLSGDSETTVARTGKDPVEVILHVNLGLSTPDDVMTGYVIDFASDGWTSIVQADRAIFSKTSPATQFNGKYTVVIPPGSGAPTNSPGGYSYATLSGTSLGVVTISGALADKSTIAQSVPVSKDGNIPLYVSLYTKKGSLQGWLTLTNTTTNQPSPVQMVVGTNIAWIKPAIAKTLYPLGFTNTDLTAMGSLYVPPALHASALNLTDGVLTVGYGDLNPPLVFSNVSVSGTKLVSTNTALSGTITASTGVLAVSVKASPDVHPAIAAKGVVLQGSTNAAGWFLNTGATNSGYFILQ